MEVELNQWKQLLSYFKKQVFKNSENPKSLIDKIATIFDKIMQSQHKKGQDPQ